MHIDKNKNNKMDQSRRIKKQAEKQNTINNNDLV